MPLSQLIRCSREQGPAVRRGHLGAPADRRGTVARAQAHAGVPVRLSDW
jgi:hypothetical protein